jgi:AcrR family transcriptional regulator
MEKIEPNRNDPREIILDSACNVFARFGFRKATMADIAKGAGLQKTSLYYYFKSKEKIFEAVMHRESRTILEAMRTAAATERSVRDKLAAFFLGRFNYLREKRSTYGIYQENIDEMGLLIARAREEFARLEEDALASILEEGVSEGEIEIENPRLFATVAIAALQGIDTAFWRRGLEAQIEAGMQLIMNIFYKGVRKE